MRILSSSVSLAASVSTTTTEVRSERARFWAGDRPQGAGAGEPGSPTGATPAIRATPAIPARGEGPATPAVPATPAGPAHRAKAGEPAAAEDPGDGLSARDEIRLLILLRTFGLHRHAGAADEIRRAYADGAAQADATSAELSRAAATAPPAAAPTRAGFGGEVDVSVTRIEATTVTFAAAADVTTADGRHIDTAATLEMQRVSATIAELQLRFGDAARTPQLKDPLAVNLAGAPAALEGTQRLDLDGDGEAEEVAQLASGSAWLARDLDGSGNIESGRELFGPASGDGFQELAALDQDGNGWVDEGDAAFAELALWDGKQLTSLSAAQIGALYTGAAQTPVAVTGADGAVAGQIRETGLYLREDGTAGTLQHVDLVA
jgi:hypothetical protein